MEKNNHPLSTMAEKILEQGVVVIENVTRMPVYGEPYLSPHLIICLNQQGHVKVEYDMQVVEFSPHDIAMVMPGHTLKALESTEDYQATLLVISADFLKWLRQNVTTVTYFRFHNRASAHLTDKQFESALAYFKILDAISQLNHPARNEMLCSQIAVGSRMCDLFIHENMKEQPNQMSDKQALLTRFYDAIVEHYKENRSVKFYADQLCLSPKYFGALILQHTGVHAGEWIARYVVIQAKLLLRQRSDLNVQQIAHKLGFEHLAAFTRYFKSVTGISPKEFRERA